MTDQPKQNKLEHQCFPQVENGAVGVWRYLDLAKFIWLLEYQKLHLARLDLLNDPHEGSTPSFVADIRDQQLRELGSPQILEQLSQVSLQSRKALYVSCWHLGNSQSEAMWRLYCSNDNGVAIRTTYKKLVESIDYDPYLYIGRVTYLDYETQGFPQGNLFYPVMHKRISFAHEQEVRLVKTLPNFWGLQSDLSPSGLVVEWPIEPTIDAIFVNPYAPDYYFDVVKSVIQRTIPNLVDRLHWSKMRATPRY